MGYMMHHVTIAVGWVGRDRPPVDIEQFKQNIPAEFRQLVIGPIIGLTNGYVSYALMADGSKEGWETSDTGDHIREQFIQLFTRDQWPDGSSPWDVVTVALPEDGPAFVSHQFPRGDR